MKFVSWNVNGFRAVLNKGFDESFINLDADFVCLQETKMQPGQAQYDPPGYEDYWHSAQRKGYSGTAVFTRHEPLSITFGLGEDHLDEGRVMTLEYPGFYLVNAYVPNAQPELVRIGYREAFEDAMRAHLMALDQKKPVIYCGDLNVAHQEIDLKYPRQNRGNPGFSDQERAKMTTLLGSGFTDTFRHLYPDKTEAYSWWSYRSNARASNAGWRIDYFLVSNRIKGQIKAADIRSDIYGSDHCPVTLEIDLK
ncbi:MAG: exodeoxyribonuclease III [Christensenellales bacterium]|nr:exodeoxyribonuclease III [Clostridiales bacterium]